MCKDTFFTIEHFVEAEIVEKKSRFICQIKHVETEEEALAFIGEIKRKHSQARHNVYAYIIKGKDGDFDRVRFTDDGEPSQTAGKPTLETLQHAKLKNVACVVTRYFGGILLGTGGLVRAYSGSVKAAIEVASCRNELNEIVDYEEREITCTYSEFETQKRKIALRGGIIDDVKFDQSVRIVYRLPL